MGKQEIRVLALASHLTKWSTIDRKEGLNGECAESWAYAFWGDVNNMFDVSLKELDNYDLVIGNTNLGVSIDYLHKLCLNRPKHVKWVSLLEGTNTDYLTPNPKLKELLDASDLVNCINKYSLGLFKRITGTKVELIGLPYNAKLITQFYKEPDSRERKTFLCGKLLTHYNDYIVGKELGLPMYGYEEKARRNLKNLYSNVRNGMLFDPYKKINKARELYNDTNLMINKSINLTDYYKLLANMFLMVNLDERYTWGRYILDAAALKVPIITTKSAGNAEELFPDTVLDNEFEIDKAIELGKRLIEDKDFYTKVSNQNYHLLENYTHENMKNKLLKCLY